jgi:dihydroorotate dehydrogenase
MDAEKAHYRVVSLTKAMLSIPFLKSITKLMFQIRDKSLEREVFGIKFRNPVGLAAGFDKDAKLIEELSCFGFGFIEIGTITPKAQDGNPKPRLFRLPDDNALINRMGFNNGGLNSVVSRLKDRDPDIIVGGNIGKNKVTPNEEALDDYILCFDSLHQYVDYFVVNVSSPNTPNLRALQDKEPLKKILSRLQERNRVQKIDKPILLKIAPDLSNEQLDDIVEIILETKIAGIIATNTTINRTNLKTVDSKIEEIGQGGLSGKPAQKRSTEVVKYLSEKSNKAFPIIAVGGVFSTEDALEKLNAGASLVQVYTGFIYEGPSMVKKINKGLIGKI